MIVYNTRKYLGYGVFLHLGSTALWRQLPFALFAACLNLFLTLTQRSEASMPLRGHAMERSTIGHPAAVQYTFAVVLSFMLVFRTGQAYNRWWEGRTAVSMFTSRFGCCALQLLSFTHNQQTRNEILRLLLLINAIVFENLRGEEMDNRHFALDDESGVITTSEVETRILDQSNPLDREYVCMAWLHTVIGNDFLNKKFFVAPPILGRAYQVLTEARLGLNHCKKIQDTPFPFAYAQLNFLMLHFFMLIIPWVCSRYIGGHITSSLIAGASVFVYFSVNAIAAEYEQPFGRKNTKQGEWSQGRLPLKHYEEAVKYQILAGSLAIDEVDPPQSDEHSDNSGIASPIERTRKMSVSTAFNTGLTQKRKSVLDDWSGNEKMSKGGRLVKVI